MTADVAAVPAKRQKKARSRIGETFNGRYQITGILGQGGMGTVYEAVQLSIGRPVALKVLLPELTTDERQVERFNREALACSKLRHPNTIRLLDYGRSEDDSLYLAVEFLDGEELSVAIRKGAMPSARVARIARQILKSVAEAHLRGLVHRDLKPANIFLCNFHGEKDFVKVLDFGIAKFTATAPEDQQLTREGLIVGTPQYLSPEQALGKEITPRTDLYALGILMYQMLTGYVPFLGDSPMETIVMHIHEAPRPFADVRPDLVIPEPLEALVHQLLSKAAGDRPIHAEMVGRMLDALLYGGRLSSELVYSEAAQAYDDGGWQDEGEGGDLEYDADDFELELDDDDFGELLLEEFEDGLESVDDLRLDGYSIEGDAVLDADLCVEVLDDPVVVEVSPPIAAAASANAVTPTAASAPAAVVASKALTEARPTAAAPEAAKAASLVHPEPVTPSRLAGLPESPTGSRSGANPVKLVAGLVALALAITAIVLGIQ